VETLLQPARHSGALQPPEARSRAAHDLSRTDPRQLVAQRGLTVPDAASARRHARTRCRCRPDVSAVAGHRMGGIRLSHPACADGSSGVEFAAFRCERPALVPAEPRPEGEAHERPPPRPLEGSARRLRSLAYAAHQRSSDHGDGATCCTSGCSRFRSWSGMGPVPRRVFKTREPAWPAGWKVRLLRRSAARRRPGAHGAYRGRLASALREPGRRRGG
jgi:hypothetical protein